MRLKSVKAAPVPSLSENAHKPKLKRSKAGASEGRKLYVLDTNVLLHDPTSMFRFEEHDVYLPMITLEELDNHKSGMTDVARNARQVSRTLDAILQHLEGPIEEGIPLPCSAVKSVSADSTFKRRLFLLSFRCFRQERQITKFWPSSED